MTLTDDQLVRFNHIQGITPNRIPAYSNEDDDFISFEATYIYGVFTGFKWQCVEFARRWLLLRKSCIFSSTASAADMWINMIEVERVTDGRKFSIQKFPNGSTTKPEIDCFLLYPQTKEMPFGHIAVITEVHENFIRVAEQNFRFHSWKGNYSREISLVQQNGRYVVDDCYPVLGWINFDGKQQMKPLDQSNAYQILEKYQQYKPIGRIERFVDISSRSSENNLIYCKVDEDFLVSLASTSNELYRLLLLATDHVIKNDYLLKEFGVPKSFWSNIRRSWTEEYHSDIFGHLDLKFDGVTLKLNNYLPDSALLVLQSAALQEQYAHDFGIDYSLTSSFQLHRLLVRHWKRLKIEDPIHILVNSEREEIVTVLYMQSVMKEAGIETKISRLGQDFFWKNSAVVDSNGNQVKIIWSLWSWEKIFQEFPENHQKTMNNGETVQLCDILLNSDIRIISPLWKSITTHPGIHHVLYNMFPNHPNLVYSDWIRFNDVTEPMSMIKWSFNESHEPMENSETDDEMQSVESDRDILTKKRQTERIVSWMIHGLFSGFSIRENDISTMKTNEPIPICCVI